jgi:hypothetical protein
MLSFLFEFYTTYKPSTEPFSLTRVWPSGGLGCQ